MPCSHNHHIHQGPRLVYYLANLTVLFLCLFLSFRRRFDSPDGLGRVGFKGGCWSFAFGASLLHVFILHTFLSVHLSRTRLFLLVFDTGGFLFTLVEGLIPPFTKLAAQAALKAQIPVLWLGANMSPTVRKSCFSINSCSCSGLQAYGTPRTAHLRLRRLKSRPQSKPRSPNCVLFASFQPSNFGFGVFLVNISLHDLEKADCRPDCDRTWSACLAGTLK